MAHSAPAGQALAEYASLAAAWDKTWLRGEIEDEAILNDLLQLPAGSRLSILDVGCATGRFLRKASSLTSGPLVGVDHCREMLQVAHGHAREQAPSANISFVLADLTDISSPGFRADLLARSPGGRGFDIIACMHVLSHFRGTEGPILHGLNGLLDPAAGRLVFNLERKPVVFGGIDHGFQHPHGGRTWTSVDTFATKKFVDEALSQAKQMVEQHMPGSAVVTVKDASRMNARMSRLRDPPYGSAHQSLTIRSQDPSGRQWSWADAIHVRLANDMDPRGSRVPTDLRVSPKDYEAALTLTPVGTPNEHKRIMDLSGVEYATVSMSRGETVGPDGSVVRHVVEPRAVQAVVVTGRV